MTDYLDVSYSLKKEPVTNYSEKLAKYICDKYYNEKRGSLLDVGCGRGDQLFAFENLGFKCVGVDSSPKSKDFLKDKFVKVDVFQEKFPFEDESFDFIFCKSVIEHIPLNVHPHFFHECYRVLKKGGAGCFYDN
jgi:ubiquinone/menaquinone biosynthesis C-methylase UbiE